MVIRKVCRLPEDVLREKAKKVPRIDASIKKLVADMIETMHNEEGIGLAAPQVGVSLRVAVLQMEQEEPVVIINPKIVKRSGERIVMEGCISVPGYQGEVMRSIAVTVKALNEQGKEIRIKAEGLMAQALEHEIDHLNGVLYIDRVESEENLHKIESEPDNVGL